jgi:hypothetical protein
MSARKGLELFGVFCHWVLEGVMVPVEDRDGKKEQRCNKAKQEPTKKRELISAGLNVSLPNTRRLGLNAPLKVTASAEDKPVHVRTAVGTATSCRKINEGRM